MRASSVSNIASRATQLARQVGTSVTVKPGDTLSAIAKQHNISLQNLLDANPHKKANPDLIRPGEIITIPSSPKGEAQNTATSGISSHHPADTATDSLTSLDDLIAKFLSQLPGSDTNSPTVTAAPQTVTVAKGDSLSAIAQRFGITTDALRNANGLHPANDRSLPVGKELRLPEGASRTHSMTSTETVSNPKSPALQPTDHPIGSLSAKYESGTRGTHAIGWDKTGGTSYGKYQINSNTMKNFIEFIKDKNPEIHHSFEKLKDKIDEGKNGLFADAWVHAAAHRGDGPSLAELEHAFIKSTHMDKAFNNIKSPALKEKIASSPTLQDVLWSTAVQHGGSTNIFNKVFHEGMSSDDFIRAVYQERGTRFSSSTEKTRAAVKARFVKESAQALEMLRAEGNNTISTSSAKRGEQK